MATFVNRTCDRLEGFERVWGGQGRAIDDGNTYFFYFPFFPQTGVTRNGNSAQQKALHLLSRGLGGREGPLMALPLIAWPLMFSYFFFQT